MKYKVIFMLTCNESIRGFCKVICKIYLIQVWAEQRGEKGNMAKKNTTWSNPPPPAPHASHRARTPTGIRAVTLRPWQQTDHMDWHRTRAAGLFRDRLSPTTKTHEPKSGFTRNLTNIYPHFAWFIKRWKSFNVSYIAHYSCIYLSFYASRLRKETKCQNQLQEAESEKKKRILQSCNLPDFTILYKTCFFLLLGLGQNHPQASVFITEALWRSLTQGQQEG